MLADALAQVLVEQRIVSPERDWDSRRREAYRVHFDSLSPLYFEKGMQRLKALKQWAQGRARGCAARATRQRRR